MEWFGLRGRANNSRNPSQGVEREFAQLTGGTVSGGQIEADALRRVLEDPENRYLGRYLCWVFAAQHMDAFIIAPRNDTDITRMVEMIPPPGSENVIHVVVGRSVLSNFDSPCAQSGLPAVAADQLLSFTLDEFAQALPDEDPSENPGEPARRTSPARGKSDQASSDRQNRTELEGVVRDVFLRLTRRADNKGMTEVDRALNYVGLRYPKLYYAVAQAKRDGKALVGIDASHSHSPTRRLVSVRLTFRHRSTDITERIYCLVDVTEIFPFLVTRFQPTYE